MTAAPRHLGAEDFFLLVFPPAGRPEGLPAHLSDCDSCRRRFSEWERAAREIAGRPETPSPDFERAVMERIGRLPAPRSRRSARAWAAGLAAAACVALAFWAGTRVRLVSAPLPDASESMSAADRADDALLRDVSRLVDEDEGSGWRELAPLPAATGGRS